MTAVDASSLICEMRMAPTVMAVTSERVRLSDHVSFSVTKAVDRPPTGCFYYLPGRWQSAAPWTPVPARDIRCALAIAGVSTVSLEYRCADLQKQSDRLAEVSTRDLLDDLSACVQWGTETLRAPILGLGGFSLGATLAVLAVLTRPDFYPDSLVLLDGGLALGITPSGDAPTSSILMNPVTPLFGLPDGGAGNRLVHPDDRFRRLVDSSLVDALQLDYLRAMYDLWPAGQVREMQAIAKTAVHEGARLSTPEVRRAFAVYTNSGAGRVLPSVRNFSETSSMNTVIELPAAWRHGDVLSHPEASRRIFTPLANWLIADNAKETLH